MDPGSARFVFLLACRICLQTLLLVIKRSSSSRVLLQRQGICRQR
jgi:hypothetical protein